MANTYTQLHVQLVFAVKYREGVIGKEWEERLYTYITGIVQNFNHKVLAINGMSDHIHILVGMRPTQSISELMEAIKGSSSKWINQEKFLKTKFAWQEGYSAFSYTKSHVPQVQKYIFNQKEHHKKESFLDEYRQVLKGFGIDYDDKYIFKPLE
ncbi:MAG: IS200/IS605 family transposase [Saprospiraceae bacterium]|nr:IS200/IS605 family transposase [Saprospiraceae bacterium]